MLTSDFAIEPTAPSRRHVIALLVLALLVRIAVSVLWLNHYAADPDGYRELGERYAIHFENPAALWDVTNGAGRLAYRPPLYPLLLGITGGISTDHLHLAARLHVILGVLTVWLTVRLGVKLRLGSASLIAGALVAVDPLLVNQSTWIMTETLAAFLTVASLDLLASMLRKPRLTTCFGAGIVLGLACLCRPTYLPFAAVAPLALIPLSRRVVETTWGKAIRQGLVTALGVAVLVGGWGFRNHRVLGPWIFGTTHGGYTLYLGNNAEFYAYLRSAGATASSFDANSIEPVNQQIWQQAQNAFWSESSMSMSRGLPLTGQPRPRAAELRADESYYQAALDTIRADIPGFLRACAYRVRRFWGLLPYSEAGGSTWLRWAIAVWYAVVFAFAVRGLWLLARSRRLWQTAWFFGLLLTLTFTAIHTIYWSDMRMRAPIMPVVCLAAAAGFPWLGVRGVAAKHASATT